MAPALPQLLTPRHLIEKGDYVIFQKQVRGFHQVSKREKHWKPRGRRPSGFIVFERLET